MHSEPGVILWSNIPLNPITSVFGIFVVISLVLMILPLILPPLIIGALVSYLFITFGQGEHIEYPTPPIENRSTHVNSDSESDEDVTLMNDLRDLWEVDRQGFTSESQLIPESVIWQIRSFFEEQDIPFNFPPTLIPKMKPTASQVIDSLPIRVIQMNSNIVEVESETQEKIGETQDTQDTEEKSKEENNCLICLEEMSEGSVVIDLPCSHFFHQKCISTWLRVANTCPQCRSSLLSSFD